LPGLPAPYALEAAGDHRGAAAAWERIGRPYDAALARAWSSDDAELKEALAGFEELGASAAAAAVRRRMKELGVKAIPRGPRAATRAAPAGLTPRAGGPGAAGRRLAGPGDLGTVVHLRADRAPSRLRGAVQDRRLLADRGGPGGRADGHRILTAPGIGPGREADRPARGARWAGAARGAANIGTPPLNLGNRCL
jgi:hypothetical protein